MADWVRTVSLLYVNQANWMQGISVMKKEGETANYLTMEKQIKREKEKEKQ